MPGFRKERLEKQIRMIVADALIKEVKDPRIGFVTVTGVKLSKDKSFAVVSVSVMGDDKIKKKTMMGLNSAKGFFQFRIGNGIKMRNTPRVVFKLDSSIEYSTEMMYKIDRICEESKPDRNGIIDDDSIEDADDIEGDDDGINDTGREEED